MLETLKQRLARAPLVNTTRWQSSSVNRKTYELRNEVFTMVLPTRDLNYYRQQLKPNLPWADDHFEKERVSRDPINPGEEWKNWPYARSAATHKAEQFDHSYAERYWPRYAGTTPDGRLEETPDHSHRGIRFDYGDLDDLVTILAGEPTTRQAYLPVWFPEDLEASKLGKRVPCSLGYHFLMRDGRLNINYFIRSCDFIRHFRDDVYMTIRLLLWVLEQCQLARPEKGWDEVEPGELTMFISSLHIFETDLL